MMVRIFFCLLITTQLHASSRVDFNELRLKQMAKVMNVRDYELMVNTLAQLEVLDLACEKELKQQLFPVSCVELSAELKKVGVKSDFIITPDMKILAYKKSGKRFE